MGNVRKIEKGVLYGGPGARIARAHPVPVSEITDRVRAGSRVEIEETGPHLDL